jgi:hypothetical protein
MQQFSNHQRITVVSRDGMQPESQELVGKTGTVVRLRLGDNGAWVKMDEPFNEKLTSFPAGDERRNYILMYPEECEPWRG